MLECWNPSLDLSEREEAILKLCRKQKLWSFFRLHRHTLLDEEVRGAIAAMYDSSGRGLAVCPERLALAMLLQVTFHVPDHEVPTLTAVDSRWRLVLDALDHDDDEPLFSQGSVFHFRTRARENGLMRTLLDKTVALARETRAFSDRRLRAMIDSSPLLGAGRVEDTFNLIGRALRSLVEVAAGEADRTADDVAKQLSLTVVSASSVKAALDVDWRQPEARNDALNALLEQVERVKGWLEQQFSTVALAQPPLSDAITLVDELVDQDTEPDPDPTAPSGRKRIKEGGADRRNSIHDADQRHGRKTKTKQFVGYKRHVSMSADVTGLVLGVRVLAANVREHEAAAPLLEELETKGYEIDELHVDRGYLPADAVHERARAGMKVVSKPPTPSRRQGRLGKADFDIDVEAGTATCPDGTTVPIRRTKSGLCATVPRSVCRECHLAPSCLPPKGQKKIAIHRDEELYQRWTRELATVGGRAARRERVAVEHGLARFGEVQGRRARYRGLGKNQFHAETCAVVVNCHVLNRAWLAAA